MSDDEDLFENPFFIALKSKFGSIYSEIEQEKHVVLVPAADSIIDMEITRNMIDAHVFKLEGESGSRHVGVYDNNRLVEIRGGRVSLLAGFDPLVTNGAVLTSNGLHSSGNRSKPANAVPSIAIKFEEMFYNKAAEPFRVICLEHATNGRSEREGDLAKLVALKTSEECQRYLYGDQVNRFVLTKMETSALLDFVAEFARGPRSESEIAKRTAKLVDHIVQQLVCANVEVRQLGKRQSVMKQFEIVVETWALHRVGPTVMSALMQSFDLIDREVHRVLRANQGITLQNLNLRPELICDFSTAIEMTINHFDRISTPMEKLLLMQDIVENVQKTIELSLSSGGRLSDNVLASDDLIPIIVFVLLQAKPQHLVSTLYYAKHFTRTNLTTSQLGFHLTTFTAAAEFIKTDHLPQSGFTVTANAAHLNPSGGSTGLGGDYIAHPLDPVSSPHFDPFAAGIEKPPSSSYRQENRRSMSYITPPVLPPSASSGTTSITTGRSFGTKSTTSNVTYPGDDAVDHGYGYATSRPQLSRSISSYDHRSSHDHQRSASYSSGSTTYSAGYPQPTSTTATNKRSNYGAMGDSAQPIFQGWVDVSYQQGASHSRIDTAQASSTSPYPPTSSASRSSVGFGRTSSTPVSAAHPLSKGPDTIALTPEESQTFFSNLKSYGNASSQRGR